MDFNFTEKKDFSPVPDGEYPVEIKKINLRQTRNRNKMWNIEFEIVAGEYEGRKIWDNLVKTDNSEWKFQNLFIACGYGGDEVKNGGHVYVSDNGDELLGKNLIVEVSTEEYNGEERNKIEKYKK